MNINSYIWLIRVDSQGHVRDMEKETFLNPALLFIYFAILCSMRFTTQFIVWLMKSEGKSHWNQGCLIACLCAIFTALWFWNLLTGKMRQKANLSKCRKLRNVYLVLRTLQCALHDVENFSLLNSLTRSNHPQSRFLILDDNTLGAPFPNRNLYQW